MDQHKITYNAQKINVTSSDVRAWRRYYHHIPHVNNIKRAKIRHSIKLLPSKKQTMRWLVDGSESRSYPMGHSALVVLNCVFHHQGIG
jgi:hypothetical protein